VRDLTQHNYMSVRKEDVDRRQQVNSQEWCVLKPIALHFSWIFRPAPALISQVGARHAPDLDVCETKNHP
jgi:hypothetical protein